MALRGFCSDGLPPGPILLVVAHPDDEVIGVGAQLVRWAPRLVCVHATDGAPRDGVDARAAGFDRPETYALARADESRAAFACAGVGPHQLRSLGLRDRSLIFDLERVRAALACILRDLRPAVVITHAYEGGHPDHDALSLVLAHIAARWPPNAGGAPDVIEFAGYHEGPAGTLVTNRFARPAAEDEQRLRLTRAQRRQKDMMLACFTTQRRTLHAFGSRDEWLRPAPAYRFTRPPNEGRVWYDRLGWEVRSGDWLAQAASFLETVSTCRAEASC